MKKNKDHDIYSWAWERRRKDKIPPDEPTYSISEAVKILRLYSDPETTEKKLRDYESDGVVTPERTAGKHRHYSVSNILSLHLMQQGTKYFGKANTMPIVKLYEISRKQPKRFDPTIFDYDPQLPGEDKIHELLHKPILQSPFQQVAKIVRMVHKIDDFLHFNAFAREHGIGFKCHDDEMLTVKRAGMMLKIAPPLTEWKGVKKARDLFQYYYARAKVRGALPGRKDKVAWNKFEKQIHKKVIAWLLNNGYAVRLKS